MKRHLLGTAAALYLGLSGGPSFAAIINVAIDIDTTRTSSTNTTSGVITTQAGFTSWDLTNVLGAGGSTIVEDGVTFEIFGIGNNQSRFRATGGGGADNNLLTDLLFHEGVANRAIGLRVSGLPIGLYAMDSWHFDSDVTVVNTENFIQVEVRNQGGPATTLVDKFPFAQTPASFEFEVTAAGQVKEIIFREDDAPSMTDPIDQNRARLNGFTLRTIPEPTSLALVGLGGLALAGWRRRQEN